MGSGTELGCGPFFFFEKSGISFFLFIIGLVQEDHTAPREPGDSNAHGLLHWIVTPIPAFVEDPAKSKHATASQEETAALVGIAIV